MLFVFPLYGHNDKPIICLDYYENNSHIKCLTSYMNKCRNSSWRISCVESNTGVSGRLPIAVCGPLVNGSIVSPSSGACELTHRLTVDNDGYYPTIWPAEKSIAWSMGKQATANSELTAVCGRGQKNIQYFMAQTQ